MRVEKLNISLPEGNFDAEAHIFEDNDKTKIKNMVHLWNQLSTALKQIGARGVNIPEGISEPLYCLAVGADTTIRITKSINGANTSFDCYNIQNHNRIQVKACSILPDLSSFGPNSQFDQLIFIDLSSIATNGTFKIFDIPVNLVYTHKVNKDQTFTDQQLQGRRPRFSLYKEIIQPNNIQPILNGNINVW